LFFLAMAESAKAELRTARQGPWLERLEREAANVRVALDWALHNDLQMALRVVGTIGLFWVLRGHLTEGRTWLHSAIASAGEGAQPGVLADALYVEGMLARGQGDYPVAIARLEECLAIRRQLRDEREVARTLAYIGHITYNQGDLAHARTLLEEAMGAARQYGDADAVIQALNGLGVVVQRQGDLEAANAYFREALQIATDAGNRSRIAGLLTNLGSVARELGDRQAARRHHEQSVAMWREIGDRLSLTLVLNNLGNVLRELGELASGAGGVRGEPRDRP
jgi:non-specific serine/threonine protein kinase